MTSFLWTCVLVERSFSMATDTETANRNRLHTRTVTASDSARSPPLGGCHPPNSQEQPRNRKEIDRNRSKLHLHSPNFDVTPQTESPGGIPGYRSCDKKDGHAYYEEIVFLLFSYTGHVKCIQ